MSKQAISMTLSKDNLLWLRAKALRLGKGSLSETLDGLLREVRNAEQEVRSVVGTVTISEDDPDLVHADQEVRRVFEAQKKKPKSKRPR